jgi:hypothetical protein
MVPGVEEMRADIARGNEQVRDIAEPDAHEIISRED